MKKLLLFGMFVFCLPLVLAVQIEQVLYDPLGSEAGGEAILIYNEENVSVDVSSWIIRSETSDVDATLPLGTILYPGKSYLIADVSWSTNKDDASWRDADYEEAITLANSNGGVAILNSEGIVDALGWGVASEIEEGLYLGTPASEVEVGKALVRVNSTGDNSLDFIQGDFLASLDLSNVLQITLFVEEPSQELLNLSVSDDDPSEGLQFIPLPGEVSVIEVRATFLRNVSALLDGVPMAFVGNSTYIGNLSLNYSTLPGGYSFSVSSGNFYEEFSYEVLPVLGVALDAVSLEVNGSHDVIGDEDPLTLSSPTFQNIGNTPVDVLVKGSAFVSGNSSLAPSIFSYSFGDVEEPLYFGVLNSQSSLVSLNLEPGALLGVNLKATLPENTLSGSYSGSVIFSGKVSQ